MTRDLGKVFTTQMEWSCARCSERIKAGTQARRVGFVVFEHETCPEPKKGKAAAKPAAQAALW